MENFNEILLIEGSLRHYAREKSKKLPIVLVIMKLKIKILI